MPETVMQKVYEPYTFSRGQIRGVFKASVMMQCNGGPERTYAHEAADVYAVSCGDEDDVNPEYRNDNSDEVFTKELAGREVRRKKVCEFMLKKMNLDLGRLPVACAVDLSDEQKTMLAWLMHPLGIQKDLGAELGVPAWAVECVDVGELLSGGR